MAMLETPSRIWRRIEAVDGRDMPSLPSIPVFDDSADVEDSSISVPEVRDDLNHSYGDTPVHSTPATVSSHTATFSMRPASSTYSATRFATSIASRSTKSALSSRGMSLMEGHADSFDASMIPSLPDDHPHGEGEEHSEDMELAESINTVPDMYLPPEEDHIDNEFTEALQSISRGSSPLPHDQSDSAATPYKDYDYSVSLRSEPKVRLFLVVSSCCSFKYVAAIPVQQIPKRFLPKASRANSHTLPVPHHTFSGLFFCQFDPS
jgi:hypothetical protein